MSIKKHIPNAITCCNLLCGCIAIIQVFEGNLVLAAYLVGLAAIFDFLDGFAARALKVTSVIGKDLDSLADMVTFGAVPGFVMHKMLEIGYLVNHRDYDLIVQNQWLTYIPILIPIFSAIRLAKFNNDTRQTDSFIGVPTPANAILICSIPLIVNWDTHFDLKHCEVIHFLIHPYALIFISVLMSILMVVELPLFSLKFKSFGWKGNEIRYIFIALSILGLILFQFLGLGIAIVLYVGLSMVNNLFFKPKTA
ncbi:MAG: CDP-alcohol phosphatidyltransferase family protein [Sphingobacteriaceae bacterium]|nr:CDP-alcohol phosphatidyltransferase family protein [Sphingobacteriaceae bacterium]MBK7817867.1 CDP-alcohol phosphatidyltransferase family protein [Sphingobacteriaceae bacterium]